MGSNRSGNDVAFWGFPGESGLRGAGIALGRELAGGGGSHGRGRRRPWRGRHGRRVVDGENAWRGWWERRGTVLIPMSVSQFDSRNILVGRRISSSPAETNNHRRPVAERWLHSRLELQAGTHGRAPWAPLIILRNPSIPRLLTLWVRRSTTLGAIWKRQTYSVHSSRPTGRATRSLSASSRWHNVASVIPIISPRMPLIISLGLDRTNRP
jgi:hypothetical protein